MGFATARNVAMYTEAKLGQLWQVLAPLLNAGVYFLIFGLIIKGVSRGVPDYLPFLVTGVFVFSFTQRTFISTSKVITDSLPLIRALKFPRAALPLAYVMIELQQMLLSMAVLFVLILAEGRAADLGLAAGRPGPAAADHVQRGNRDVRREDRRAGQRLRAAAAVPDADLAVPVRRDLQHPALRRRALAEPRMGDHAPPAQPGRHLHHLGPAVVAEVTARKRLRRAALQRGQVLRLGRKPDQAARSQPARWAGRRSPRSRTELPPAAPAQPVRQRVLPSDVHLQPPVAVRGRLGASSPCCSASGTSGGRR